MGEDDALVLAEHAEKGGLTSDAIEAWLRAAEEALSGSDLGAVLARADRGIALGATGEKLGALRLLQAKAHRWRSEQVQAEGRGLEAMRCLPSGSALWFDAAGEVAVASGLLGRLDHLVDLGEALLTASDASAGGASLIACARAATFFFLHGQHDLAEAVLARIEAGEQRLGALEPDVRGRVCYVRATHALITGDLGRYLTRSEEAAACFETAGNVRSLAVQRLNVGNAHLLTGGWAEAATALRAALALAERTGSQSLLAETRQGLAAALAEQGDYERALAVGTAGAEAAARVGARRAEAQARSVVARVAERAGDRTRAEAEVRAALMVSEGLPAVRAWALAVAAELALSAGKVDVALQHAQAGLKILRELGALEVGEALLRLTWAEALTAAGRADEARAAGAEARTWLEARAAKIKDGALRERFRREVPENARIGALPQPT